MAVPSMKVTTELHTVAVNDIVLLTDTAGPLGACPYLPVGWADRSGPENESPAVTHAACYLHAPTVTRIAGCPSYLVIGGRQIYERARAMCLRDIPVRVAQCAQDQAIFFAARELLRDPALHKSSRKARELAVYMRWLIEDAEVLVEEDARRQIGPVVAPLLDASRGGGLMKSLARITGYTERSLRAREYARFERASSPPHDAANVRVLVAGDVTCTQDGSIKARRSAREPHQFELRFTAGGESA